MSGRFFAAGATAARALPRAALFIMALQLSPTPAWAQDAIAGGPPWFSDSKGCRHFDAEAGPSFSLEWSGACVNGLADGTGQRQWSVGGKPIVSFVGPVKAGRAEGQGILRLPGGGVYEGDFKDGLRQGHAVLRGGNGFIYEGDFVGGKPSGAGKARFGNGDSYEGGYRAGYMDGEGQYRWAQGDVYQGQFSASRPAGQGELRFTRGGVYRGDFVAGRAQGKGVALSPEGNRYTGEFLDGLPTGQGVITTAAGEVKNPPLAVALLSEFSFAFPSTAVYVRPGNASMFCTKMSRPAIPLLNWTGQARYLAQATIRGGRVVSIKLQTLVDPKNEHVNASLTDAITRVLHEGYECPGDHVIEQEFQFKFE
ncbi:hypothetical protein WG899_18980 [Paucibacter sp. AS339]|uniref:MORN repeat-containing protein n=1 Tax=Paucibacter hankyongi TaxID=3133434 RepID=UPI0030A7F98A